MQLLFDFFPVIAFFVAYKVADIYVATGVIIAAVVVQVAIQWLRHRKLSAMMLISAALVLVFGTITLLVHDKTFIMWKPTVLNWLFAAGFVVSQYVGEQPVIQRLMGASLTLGRPTWIRLNLMWAGFFVLMGALNLYVAYAFDEATWVNFKLFGMLGLTLVFAVLQGLWLSSRLPPDDASPPAGH